MSFTLRTPLRLAVFASGGGSNMQAILDAISVGTLEATVALCVCNKPHAGAIARAEKHDIPVALLNPSDFGDEADYTHTLLTTLARHHVNFVALAGYLRKVPAAVVEVFRHRMVNIHPALLPAFGGAGYYGKRVHQAVIEHGVRFTGVTVHLVDEAYDTGPIVLQAVVPVYQDDTPEVLAVRVLKEEHKLYPKALQLFAQGRITIDGRRVLIHE